MLFPILVRQVMLERRWEMRQEEREAVYRAQRLLSRCIWLHLALRGALNGSLASPPILIKLQACRQKLFVVVRLLQSHRFFMVGP